MLDKSLVAECLTNLSWTTIVSLRQLCIKSTVRFKNVTNQHGLIGKIFILTITTEVI